jgi:hypothetical protein
MEIAISAMAASKQTPLSHAQQHSQLRPDAWLPMSKKELDARGWDFVDVILFTGDAYVEPVPKG